MNYYLRYFEKEILVNTVDEAIRFLAGIPEIGLNRALESDVRNYLTSDVFYPKRYKVRPRVYFIIIKTEAKTMRDFKEKRALHATTTVEQRERVMPPELERLKHEQDGWYEGTMNFKRVLLSPATGKYEYIDTRFVARCKACSGLDCYNRMAEYLRDKVDPRSQFPSPKGRNFSFIYLGQWKK